MLKTCAQSLHKVQICTADAANALDSRARIADLEYGTAEQRTNSFMSVHGPKHYLL